MSEESSKVNVDDSKLRRKLEEDFTEASKDKMQVFLRIRPFKRDELENEGNRHCLTIQGDKTVLLRVPLDSNAGKNLRDSMRIHQRFTFSNVFGPEIEQREFFEVAVLPTVKDSLRGETCLIFAYGATNSGKSYTIQGTGCNPGIIPRALAVIFKSTKSDLDTTENKEMADIAFQDGNLHSVNDYAELHVRCTDNNASDELFDNGDDFLTSTSRDSGKIEELLSESVLEESEDIVSIFVSFAEIYNENIYDLLEPTSFGQKRRNLKLVNDRHGGRNHIKGLRHVRINSVEEACRMLQIGKTNLHISSTKLNRQSSRSHCIFTIHMIRSKSPDQPEVNSLTFCDLAGLERVAKTQNTGSRLKEAGNINTSLLVLGRCIEAIREKRMVPFRDSKLTRLFQGYFTENGKASMIVNVGQSSEMFNDTLHVLKFSASAKEVVSVDNLERSRFWDQSTASNSSRITELWPMARQRWSEFSKSKIMSKASIATVEEEVLEESNTRNDTQEELSDIQELIEIVWKLEKKVQDLMNENLTLEVEIRKEVCQEFDKIMADMDKKYEDMLKSSALQNEETMNRRLSILKKSLIAKYEREYGEEDTFESSSNQSIDESIDCSSSADASKIECGTTLGKDASINASESVCPTPKEEWHDLKMEERHVLEQERRVLLEDVLRVTKEKNDLLAERKTIRQDLEKIEKESAALTKEKEALAKESAVLQRENERLMKEMSRVNDELSTLEKQHAVTTKANVALEVQVASLQEVLRNKQDADNYEQLRLENQQLKEENASLAVSNKRATEDAEEEIKKLSNKVASLEAELQCAKTDDDFKPTKKMNTRGRKRATGEENAVPKRSRKLEEPEVTTKQVGLRSPLDMIKDAIRQSPTFQAMGRVLERLTGTPAPQRRTRRKLYKKDESDLNSEVPSDSPPKESVPQAAAKRPVRNTRKKK